MSGNRNSRRIAWLLTGFVAGIAMASLWPHEPLSASSSDRNDKFAVITAPVSVNAEAVFVVDFLTGRLTGGVLSRIRGNNVAFTNFYFRNLAEDFDVTGNTDPYYAVTAGFSDIPNAGGFRWGTNALYVGELNSGKLRAYGIPYVLTQVPQNPIALVPLAEMPFREATVTE